MSNHNLGKWPKTKRNPSKRPVCEKWIQGGKLCRSNKKNSCEKWIHGGELCRSTVPISLTNRKAAAMSL